MLWSQHIMIQLQGRLNIKSINGSRGAFSVADLVTAIGTFKVKDAWLDQYDPGSYAGTFTVAQISPSSYIVGGRVMVEIRATLTGAVLDQVEDASRSVRPAPLPPEPSSAEPDPVDEPVPPKKAPPTTTAVSAAATPDADDELLFGAELLAVIQRLEPVKLDPTVDRIAFRKQRDRLKALGYTFAASTQTWFHSPAR